MTWTAAYTSSADKAELWEQSVAILLTKAYIKKNKTSWNHDDYNKAIVSIYDNIVISDKQKIKLAKNTNGEPISMIYNCSQCDRQGTFTRETPVTLDDIRRISQHFGITMKAFFRNKIAPEPSTFTGGLKLMREKHCVFFHVHRHCTIKDVRPMHCRFTPCPAKTKSAEMFDCFFLGSGTVEEQFRHQVALAITRQYVNESNVMYNKHLVKKLLKTIDGLASNRLELEKFSRKLSSFRYVDDTLMISGPEKIYGHNDWI
jgi:Fe-S-cluster containining protein